MTKAFDEKVKSMTREQLRNTLRAADAAGAIELGSQRQVGAICRAIRAELKRREGGHHD